MRLNQSVMSIAFIAASFAGSRCELRALERLVERPRRLLELERAALADAVLIRVRESAGVEEHRDDARRAGAA